MCQLETRLPRMLMNRVALEIGDTLVEREQDPIGGKGGIHYCWVCRTAKSFAGDRVGIVAQAAKIRHQFHREVLVKVELPIARIGTRRSSCANSAAYAKTALMWSARSEG